MAAPAKVAVKELNSVSVQEYSVSLSVNRRELSLWKYHVLMMFSTKEIEGVVLGTELRDDAEDKVKWDKGNSMARLCIFSAIGGKQMRGLIKLYDSCGNVGKITKLTSAGCGWDNSKYVTRGWYSGTQPALSTLLLNLQIWEKEREKTKLWPRWFEVLPDNYFGVIEAWENKEERNSGESHKQTTQRWDTKEECWSKRQQCI